MYTYVQLYINIHKYVVCFREVACSRELLQAAEPQQAAGWVTEKEIETAQRTHDKRVRCKSIRTCFTCRM